ncbi:hypothetical protein Plim_3855 [Planctopirus limnophila DSM 3776]|uniref:Uncharacterized protein n=1 Tax=Planctopirus limnophila (strain ATCC 43296 / DSM 3776 / IFAM 1008 / Mu 290) TaxID=521674 RepID=D5SX45_PLAL2|nr:hypothetical protein Plim_3855 [Planctopirus limnophila DSM 3776]
MRQWTDSCRICWPIAALLLKLSESFPALHMEPRFPSGARLESSICDQQLVESTPEREILVAEAFDRGFDCS